MPEKRISSDVTLTSIRPVSGLVPLNLHELWEYRELVVFMLLREIKGRYRQTALGPLWIVLAPIVNMVLFTLIFGKLAKFSSDISIPYPLFSYSALLPWGFFSGSLFMAAVSLYSYKDLISKVYFPRLIVPLVGVAAALVDFLISFGILIVMTYSYGYALSLHALMIPVYLLLAALTGLAVGLWSATIIVHFQDVNTILGYVVKVWMYASPVVYATTMVPEKLLFLYRLNPMTTVIEGFRWALLSEGTPSLKMLLISFLTVIPILVSGAYYFRRTERNIVDIA